MRNERVSRTQALRARRRVQSRRGTIGQWAFVAVSAGGLWVLVQATMPESTPEPKSEGVAETLQPEPIEGKEGKREAVRGERETNPEVERLKLEIERRKREAAKRARTKIDPPAESVVVPKEEPRPDPAPIATITPKDDKSAMVVRRLSAVPDAREQGLHSSLLAAQASEERARSEVRRLASLPYRRATASMLQSSLRDARTRLELAERFTSKARREYDQHVHNRRMEAKALELAAALPRDKAETGRASPNWNLARVRALWDSVRRLHMYCLNGPAIVRLHGGGGYRRLTEEEEDAQSLGSACSSLASRAMELARSSRRPKEMARTADAALRLYNRCATYCGKPTRGIDSPVPSYAAEIAAGKVRRAKEVAERNAADGRWNGRKLSNMLRSIQYIRDKKKRKATADLVWAADKLMTKATSGPQFERFTAVCETALAALMNHRPPKDGRKRTVRDF
jgi:hypothetical protein